MRAVTLHEVPAEPSVAEVDTPRPAEGQLLVELAASSVNGFDLSVLGGNRQGMMEHRFPLVVGMDSAGAVEALGEGVAPRRAPLRRPRSPGDPRPAGEADPRHPADPVHAAHLHAARLRGDHRHVRPDHGLRPGPDDRAVHRPEGQAEAAAGPGRFLGTDKLGFPVSRADIAAFAAQQVQDGTHAGRAPAISK
ncbi:alcohol dehydrogenase catalytic domain-containing protein [Streptomyces abyssomicinicus]|uniref:alcohol dehydrogenase catalytic domain-containing protein n=1 Tax=Streptomyces abyssomicinicus TaxID=574929 RepID=UPI001C3FE799|nr:alcohol dehydrogenase catalytic domain-containing protein [Streptomyces abyssomicinicus]